MKTLKQELEEALMKASQDLHQALHDPLSEADTGYLDGIAVGLHRALDIMAEHDTPHNTTRTGYCDKCGSKSTHWMLGVATGLTCDLMAFLKYRLAVEANGTPFTAKLWVREVKDNPIVREAVSLGYIVADSTDMNEAEYRLTPEGETEARA